MTKKLILALFFIAYLAAYGRAEPTPNEILLACPPFEETTQYQDQMESIHQGVAQIEDTFGLTLVDNIILVDCEKVENAITVLGKKNLWFDVDILKKVSLSELQVIGAHETLHLLVDRYHFTESIRLRTLFADLMQYDELSVERFFLTTSGVHRGRPETPHIFCEFINEKNFMEDCGGGHAEDNLDEFCTSFLHTLLHIDRLDMNLRRLPEGQRREVLAYYQEVIEILLERATDPAINNFLNHKLSYVGGL